MLAALALATTLTLGPLSFTYPELAAALTKAGMPTEASPSLGDRAAFVHLHDRSPESTRRLLGEALGVAFEPQKEGGWRMVADPAVKDRDRRFLTAYERVAARTLREWAGGWQAVQAGRGYAANLAELRQRSADLDAREGAGTTQEDRRGYFHVLALARPTFWNLVHQGAGLDRMASAVRGPVDVEMLYGQTGLPDAIGDNAALIPVPPTAEIVLHHRFDPAEGVFVSEDELVTADRRDAIRLTYPWQYARGFDQDTRFGAYAERDTTEATFAAMGKEAAAYLATLVPRPELPSRPSLALIPSDISTALERLGPDLPETVMELSPAFEDLPSGRMRLPAAPVNLRSVLTAVPYESYYLGSDSMVQRMSKDYGDLLRRRGERRFPLRALERDGAILIENPYAFLDRAQWLSPVPFLRLQRLLAKEPDLTREAGDGLVPTWDLLVRMSLEVRSYSTLARMAAHNGYRGVGLGQSAALEPLLAPIATLSGPERRALWATLRRDGRASIALSEGRLDLTAGGAPRYVTLNHVGRVYVLSGVLQTPRGSGRLGGGLLDGLGTLVP